MTGNGTQQWQEMARKMTGNGTQQWQEMAHNNDSKQWQGITGNKGRDETHLTWARAVRLDASQYRTAPWGSCRAMMKRGTVTHSSSSFTFPITHRMTALPAALLEHVCHVHAEV